MTNRRTLFQVLGATLALAALTGAPAHADDAFKPEVFKVEPEIAPGPNVFVNQASWDGASRIHVYGQDGLQYKGLVSMGLTSQVLISDDSSTIYTISDYMKRYTYGPIESVVQAFDVKTLKPKGEVIVPNSAAQAIGMTQIIENSADGKLVYVQNATPATSVTVVDMDALEVVAEVPTPGCYGIVAAASGHKFSTLCGTGQFKTYQIDGKEYTVETSEKIFSVEDDPLYLHAERRSDDELIFASFNGNLYLVDDSGNTVALKKTVPVTEGVEGDWAPGGYAITAYNQPNDMLFMIVHSDAYDGSHKDASEEIWAFSMADEKLVSRSEAPYMTAIDVTQGESPHIYGTNEEEESVDEYVLADEGEFQFVKKSSDDKVGWATSLLVGQ